MPLGSASLTGHRITFREEILQRPLCGPGPRGRHQLLPAWSFPWSREKERKLRKWTLQMTSHVREGVWGAVLHCHRDLCRMLCGFHFSCYRCCRVGQLVPGPLFERVYRSSTRVTAGCLTVAHSFVRSLVHSFILQILPDCFSCVWIYLEYKVVMVCAQVEIKI